MSDKLNAPQYLYTQWTNPPPPSLDGIVAKQGEPGWSSTLFRSGQDPVSLGATDGLLTEADGEVIIVNVGDYVVESLTGGWCDFLGEMLNENDRFVIPAAKASTWIPAGEL